MHLPEIDKYSHLDSPLHKWDPRLKIVCITCLIFSIVFISNFSIAILGLLFSIILVFISKIPFSFVLKHLKWVFFFVSFFLLIMPLSVPGNEIVRFHCFRISYEGVRYGFLISIKAISAVLLIFPMMGTMPFPITIKTLERLKIPKRMVQLIMFTYRYIFLFIDEAQKMFVAMQSRGFKKKTNLHTFRTIGKLVGMLFVRSYERTEGIYQAMISRGYNGDFKYLEERELKICAKDILKAIMLEIMAIGIIILEIIK